MILRNELYRFGEKENFFVSPSDIHIGQKVKITGYKEEATDGCIYVGKTGTISSLEGDLNPDIILLKDEALFLENFEVVAL